tara:strand:+ start:258 stop:518 length:261 start_codon:yes stop_codon:yes gene_type:complete
MKKQDLEYLLETLNYGLNDCDDKNGNTETHFNSFANAINLVQDELNLLNIHVVSKSFYCECNEPLELRMIPNGTPYCEECGKNIKQ